MSTYDLVCIGCGPAGEKAASYAAAAGRRVAVVERRRNPGGAMVNTGTVPSKALRETALLCSAFRRRPLPGTDVTLDRTMSVPRFMARRYLIEQQEHDYIESVLDHHGVDILHGNGRLIDANSVGVTPDGGEETTIEAKYILIATGSSPVRPDHIPFGPRVVDADGILQLERLPERLLIVGAGVIGCEYASVFSEMGVRVTLINMHDEILPFLDRECALQLERMMAENGVELQRNVAIEQVAATADDVTISCGEGRRFVGDVLLWSAGRSSNTAGLGLEGIGVEMGNRGLVKVDEHYQTNVPTIYAAGDVIGFPALASTSKQQGRVAASRMFGLDFHGDARSIPYGIYTIPGISMVGLTEKEAVEKGHDCVVGRTYYRDNVRGRMLGDEQGMLKCVFDRRTHQLLGASIIGEQAIELIHVAQAVLDRKDGIAYFVDACFNYPSLAEMYRGAAFNALCHANDDRQAA